jgi:glucose/arabinose dehydrogenase
VALVQVVRHRLPLPRRFTLAGLGLAFVAAGCLGTSPVSSQPEEQSASPPAARPSATRGATAAPSPSPRPSPSPSPTLPPLQRLDLAVVADGLENPIDVRARPGDGALFVAEQRGVIQRIDGGGVADEPMLDIRDEVNDQSIEQGLLGFAFHPTYPADPRVFVYHSRANNDNVLASYSTAGDPNVLDPGSRTDLLVVDKERDKVRHNGGTVLFGPDGLLYLSIGDAARYSVNAQDPSTLPASILRLDVDGAAPYEIPAGNPFGEGGDPPDGLEGAPEVWWFGFRNPWRFTIDEQTGLAYIADVGQERAEEVNVVPFDEGGLNFGWPAREGLRAFVDFPLVSDATDPVIDIRHNDRDRGCSVTGGEVYRGTAIPEIDGLYFYADWCFGWIRSFRFADGAVADERDWSDELDARMVSSFGHDADGELLLLDWDADTLSRVVPVR